MACTVENFRLRFPEFSDSLEYSDARIQLFLDDSVNFHIGTDEVRWCGKYDYAHCYLTAHLLARGSASELGDSSSQSGVISSKSAGGVSVTRSVVAKSRSDLDEFYVTTTYGQQFITIRNTCFIGVRVATIL